MRNIGVDSLALVSDVFSRAGLEISGPDDQSLSLSSPTAHYTCDVGNSDVCQIRGSWRRTVSSPEDRKALLRFAAQCNRERVVPKAYTVPTAGGRAITLAAEVNTLSSAGLSEEQFYGCVDSAVTAIATLFADAEKMLQLHPVQMGVVRDEGP